MKRFSLLLVAAILCGINMLATNISSSFTVNTTLTKSGGPYYILNDININNGVTVTVEDSTEIYFADNAYLQVFGTLNASGALFSSSSGSPAPGSWEGIYVAYEGYSYLGSVTLDSCVLEYAQNIWLRKGTLNVINNTIIRSFSGAGVDVYQQGILNIDESTITLCNRPITTRNTDGGLINFGSNLDLTGNTEEYIYINFRDLNQKMTFKDVGIPYYFDSEFRITETGEMVVEPGAKFLGNTNAYFNVYGKIKAMGTKDKPVVFDKWPTQNYWVGFNFQDNSVDTACVMRNCEIKGARYDQYGYAYYNRPHAYNVAGAAIEFISASPTIDSCRFTNNYHNLYIRGLSSPMISNCYLGESATDKSYPLNINVDWNATPQFAGDTLKFTNTEARAIGVVGHSVYDDATIQPYSVGAYDSLTFVLMGNISLVDTTSVTIAPGTVMKVWDNDYGLYMYGTVNAVGTDMKPIVYTFINDDNFGKPADTRNDGTSSVSYSSSGRLYVYNLDGNCTLDKWKIHYAGYNSSDYAVRVRGSNTLTNCEIKYSHRAVYFWDDAQIIGNHFEEISNYPVARWLNSGNPVLLNNTITSVGSLGILLTGFAPDDTFNVEQYGFAGALNTAYVIAGDLTLPTNTLVTIDPGVVIKFEDNYKILVDGGLKAVGTLSNRIIFTSIKDDSAGGDTNNNGTGSTPATGNWRGLAFNSGSMDDENMLKHFEIRYSQGYGDLIWPYSEGSIRMINCKVTMDSILMNFCSSSALAIYGDANPIITNSEFYNIGSDVVFMDMFADPTFSGNVAANIPRISIRLRGQTLNGTVPIRSFLGYDTITYIVDEVMTVADHLVIPAGLTFKTINTARYWNINGLLEINGTQEHPVIFTSLQDDNYGNPKDTEQNGQASINNRGTYFYFNDVSDDASVVNHAKFYHSYTTPIICTNSSPTVKNCHFESYAAGGVSLSGPSMPTIDTCTFHNISYPFNTSLVTYPAQTRGNVISGSTARAIRVNNETVSQDITVSKKNFAGITNIPWLFDDYTVGSSAIMTIEPGVICKFLQDGYLNIYKGLQAIGGGTPDSTIIFTAALDDFYGGDTYNDGDATSAGNDYWWGIKFFNESLDQFCELNNVIIKNASYDYYYDYRGAVTLDNSSPTIQNTLFEYDRWGIISSNTSLPTLTLCDFVNIGSNAVWNRTPANLITAENCWWNHNTGPYHATLNPGGLGEPVSDGVDFDPWATQLAKPELGDASLNGEIKPYDASLVLQHAVNNITLSAKQQGVADVSKNGSVTAYDASLILQYTVGLITEFNEDGTKAANVYSAYAKTNEDFVQVKNRRFEIPIDLSSGLGVKALDMKFSSNSKHVHFVELKNGGLPNGVTVAQGYNAVNGDIRISMASAYDLDLSNQVMSLVFEVVDASLGESSLKLLSLLANEQASDQTLSITLNSSLVSTGIDLPTALNSLNVYNVNELCHIDLNLADAQKKLLITFTDLSGKTTNQIIYNDLPSGNQSFTGSIFGSGMVASQGIYIVTIKGDNFNVAHKLLVK